MAHHTEWRETLKLQQVTQGDEYACEYNQAPNQYPDMLGVVERVRQLWVYSPVSGWRPSGDPVLDYDILPYQLRSGAWANMSDDPGFVQLIKTS